MIKEIKMVTSDDCCWIKRFDERGNQIEYLEYNYFDSDNLSVHYSREYDENNNLVRDIDNISGIEYNYEYDINNNIICEKSDNEIIKQFNYDENNKLISINYDDGIVTQFTYNEKGDCILEVDIKDCKIKRTKVIVYDYNNLSLIYKEYFRDKLLGTTEGYIKYLNKIGDEKVLCNKYNKIKFNENINYIENNIYDERGLLIESNKNENGEKYIYDNENKLVSTICSDGLIIDGEYNEYGDIIKLKFNDGYYENYEYIYY